MAARTPINTDIRQPQRRPVAAPVDAFERTRGGAQLEQLARGLAQVSPGIKNLGMAVFERSAEEDRLEGEAEARRLAEQGIQVGEAVRKKLIPAHKSPWFMSGLQEQFGRTAADRWNQELGDLIRHSPDLEKFSSMEQFDAFVQKHRKDFMEKNVGEQRDERFEVGFGHRADAYLNNRREQFSAMLDGRVKEWGAEQHFQEVAAHALNMWTADPKNPDAPAPTGADIARGLNLRNDAQIALGHDPRMVNEATVEALAAAALEKGGVEGRIILSAIDHIRQGSGNAGTTRKGLALKQETLRELDRVDAERLRAANAAEEKRKEEAKSTILGQLGERVWDNPSANIRDLVKAAKDAGIPDIIPDMISVREAAQDGAREDNDDLVVILQGRIFGSESVTNPVTEDEINAHAARRAITPGTQRTLLNMLKEHRSGANRDILNNPEFERRRMTLRAKFGLDAFLTDEQRIMAERAEVAFTLAWIEANRNGTAGKDPRADAKLLYDNSEFYYQQQTRDTLNMGLGQGKTPRAAVPRSKGLTEVKSLVVPPAALDEYIRTNRAPPAIIEKLVELQIPESETRAFINLQLQYAAEERKRKAFEAGKAKREAPTP